MAGVRDHASGDRLGLVGLAQFLPGVLLFLVADTPPIAATAAGCS